MRARVSEVHPPAEDSSTKIQKKHRGWFESAFFFDLCVQGTEAGRCYSAWSRRGTSWATTPCGTPPPGGCRFPSSGARSQKVSRLASPWTCMIHPDHVFAHSVLIPPPLPSPLLPSVEAILGEAYSQAERPKRRCGQATTNSPCLDQICPCIHPFTLPPLYQPVYWLLRRWFRPGHGWFTPSMLALVEAMGLTLALGNVFPHDPWVRHGGSGTYPSRSRLSSTSLPSSLPLSFFLPFSSCHSHASLLRTDQELAAQLVDGHATGQAGCSDHSSRRQALARPDAARDPAAAESAGLQSRDARRARGVIGDRFLRG